MVTLERASYQTQKRYAEYCGLSGDQKPIEDINNGDEFQEIDTGFTYKFNTESMQWVKQPQGDKGNPGPQGPPGPEGPPGQAATIEIAETETVSSDAPAAMVELPDSTPQARRYKAQVPQGVQGPKGDKGDTGPQGDVGPQGEQGPAGPAGPEGPQGPAGTGLPALSGPEDAGKTPVVNQDGTGWLLGAGGGEEPWKMLSDYSITQPDDAASIKFDGIEAKEFFVFFYGVLNNEAHDAPSATGLVDIRLNGKPAGRFSVYVRTSGGYESTIEINRQGDYVFFERSTRRGSGWGQYEKVECGNSYQLPDIITQIELVPESSMLFVGGFKLGLWYR